MKKYLDKFFLRSNNLDLFSSRVKQIYKNKPVKKIFDLINSYSPESEIRFVGGCIRKIIKNENVDDIDLATNLDPNTVCNILKKKNISYYESGIEHGTITALIDKYRLEITTLREDISTDGRHAKVKFSKNWKQDASRRDFKINSIYSDKDGNIFDPYEGKSDLEKGIVNFIGDPDKRIKEDYLRILRYLRFFLIYSKHPHDYEVIKKLKININGVSKLSKERLFDELKKFLTLNTLQKLCKDKISLDLFLIIFPEIKNIKIFNNLESDKIFILKDTDYIFFLSLLIIDGTDNIDYFFFKFNLSKKDQKRIKIINDFFIKKNNPKTFTQKSINKVFYYHGRQAVEDILNFKLIKDKRFNYKISELCKSFKNKPIPSMPIGAETLMKKYKFSEGKELGVKLKILEEEWIRNNFQISDKKIESIIGN